MLLFAADLQIRHPSVKLFQNCGPDTLCSRHSSNVTARLLEFIKQFPYFIPLPFSLALSLVKQVICGLATNRSALYTRTPPSTIGMRSILRQWDPSAERFWKWLLETVTSAVENLGASQIAVANCCH
jgi:hypothetical protein